MVTSVFRSIDDSSVLLWSGDPNCQAAHDAILQFLSENCLPFPTAPDPNSILRGNLGETITFCLGKWEKFGSCLGHFANALRPFSGKSNPEIDLLWYYLAEKPVDDWAVFQEVKTTGKQSVKYAESLLDDYEKLFGIDPRLTLHTRIQDFKNRLQFQQNQTPPVLARITRLCGTSPVTSPKIRLVPTAVHDATASDVVETMLAIRDTLIGRQWHDVEPWAIGLSDLNQRLMRLAKGEQ